MRLRFLVGLGFLLSAASLGAFVACASPTPPDVPDYGPPNGIDGKHPSTPEGVDDGGGVVTPPQDAGPVTTFACGTPVSDAGCAVSWKNDIYAKMKSGGAWGCGTVGSCHGSVGGTKPFVDPSSESATYASLQLAMPGVNPAGSLPYIDPCSSAASASLFVCNTTTTTCSVQMPLVQAATNPPTALLSPADQTLVEQWVACGAPEN